MGKVCTPFEWPGWTDTDKETCVGKPPASVRHDRSCQEIPKIGGMRCARQALANGPVEGIKNLNYVFAFLDKWTLGPGARRKPC
jgi:hypothetical protein